jgi:hypothetical protein
MAAGGESGTFYNAGNPESNDAEELAGKKNKQQ